MHNYTAARASSGDAELYRNASSRRGEVRIACQLVADRREERRASGFLTGEHPLPIRRLAAGFALVRPNNHRRYEQQARWGCKVVLGGYFYRTRAYSLPSGFYRGQGQWSPPHRLADHTGRRWLLLDRLHLLQRSWSAGGDRRGRSPVNHLAEHARRRNNSAELKL